MKRILFFCCLCLASLWAEAQVQLESLQLPVRESGRRQKLAWAGGLQSPQLSPIDLNFDGIPDLIAFDRFDNSVLPFLNSGQVTDTAYTFAPEYAAFFPQDLQEWVLLYDFNCDGKADIFTAGRFDQVRVFQNTSANGQLSFQLLKNPLRATNGPISIPSSDIPAFADVDNDGDLDLVAFTTNSDFVTWFKNMRVENNVACLSDTLVFQRQTSCWGFFEEDFFTSALTLNRTCGGNRQMQKTNLHAGSTLLLFDADNDGDKEVLVGDIASQNLAYLVNGGTPTVANMVSQTTVWPPSNPIQLYSFPAAYFLDVDNDGLKDLAVAPNSGGAGSKNFDQVLYYRNTGTNTAPNFNYQKNNFLVGEMIELGTGAAPAFFDFDKDGDLDLVIGNENYAQSPTNVVSQLALYQNVGTNQNPVYQLVTRDYAGLSSRNLLALSPTFGDLDNDGDMDMLLGESQGFVYYFRNDATGTQPANFTFVSANYLNGSVGSNSTPVLTDVDNDGDLDLIVGERNGNLNFYRNNGSVSSPNFSLVNATFGNVNVRNPQIGAGYSAPAIGDLNQNGQPDLLVGDYDGQVHYFPDFGSNLSGTFTERTLAFLNPLNNIADPLFAGRRAMPAIANLTADNLPDVLAGIGRGGLRAYRNGGLISGLKPAAAAPLPLEVYPNPFGRQLNLTLPAGPAAEAVITDLTGRRCFRQALPPHTSQLQLELPELAPGLYFLNITRADGAAATRKILKVSAKE